MDQQNQLDVLNKIKNFYTKYWERHPFFTKLLILQAIIFYIVNLITNNTLANYLSNDIQNTLYNAQLWRILTQSYVHKGIFELIFCSLLVYFDASALEKIIGSGTYFLHFSLKNAIISLNNISLAYIFYVITDSNFIYENCCSTGYWPAIISDIIIRAVSLPNEKLDSLFIFPVKINNKIYAIIIITLIFLIYLPALELIAAFIFVYIECSYFNGMILRIKKKTVKSIENYICCLFRNRQDYIDIDNCNEAIFKRDNEDDIANLDENLEQNKIIKNQQKLSDQQNNQFQQQLEIQSGMNKNTSPNSGSDMSDQEHQ